eukprot:202498-Rhodomonas_salina.1
MTWMPRSCFLESHENVSSHSVFSASGIALGIPGGIGGILLLQKSLARRKEFLGIPTPYPPAGT